MLSSCLKLLLGLSLFVILTECMPKTQFTEDDKSDEDDSDLVDIGDDKAEDYDSNNDGRDENGNLITDAPKYQEDDEAEVNNTTDLTEDGENDEDENDEADDHDTDANEDNKIDETDGHDGNEDIKTDAPEIICRRRDCSVRTFFQNCACVQPS